MNAVLDIAPRFLLRSALRQMRIVSSTAVVDSVDAILSSSEFRDLLTAW